MGLFSKRTPDSEWLREFSPLVERVSDHWDQFSTTYLSFSGDGLPLSQELARLGLLADQIKSLPSPTSPRAKQAKSGFDIGLRAKIDLQKVMVESKVWIAGQSGVPPSDPRKIESDIRNMQRREFKQRQLEQKIAQQIEAIGSYFNGTGISWWL